MIKTKGLYHIGIPVDDVERAVKFYTEVLGMTIAKLNRDDMGEHLNRADLRAGNDMVVLFQRPKPLNRDGFVEDGATHHAFVVSREDFDLAVKKMKDWGVRTHSTPTVDRPSGSGFYFFDPDGNLLQLYTPPKGQSAPVG
ncbi:MAG TPA: VOC family protein [Candidatus Binatia bacterium]|jgi:catechol 2,3-dioxygenase-like lactoylglutathione lyase family enzyme